MKFLGNLLLLAALLLQTLSGPLLGQSARLVKARPDLSTPVEVPAVREQVAFDEVVAKTKIAPDLQNDAEDAFAQRTPNETRKVIIQLKSESGLNEQFGALPAGDRASTFARENQTNRRLSSAVGARVSSMGGRVSKTLNNLGLVAAEFPLDKIRELSEDPNVAYISPDREVTSSQHIGNTTGINLPSAGIDLGDHNDFTWLNGSAGRLAVIDSGIDTSHRMLNQNWYGQYIGKVDLSRDFTGENITGDPYGHGTHVASMFDGDSTFKNGSYRGVADGVKILNLRVLNRVGTGRASSLIAALDWVVANKTIWDIRVVNMSLSTPASDSYLNDPLCIAAPRVVNAGVVVVASAGNYGKDE